MTDLRKVDIIDSNDEKKKLAEIKLLANQEQLKNILLELLGKPESINREMTGNFVLELDHLLAFDDIVRGKVIEQNDLVIDIFSITLFFDDNSSRTITSRKDLENFRELRNLSVNAINQRWVLLLNIGDMGRTLKQEINLTFDTTKNEKNVSLSVLHTTRFWGIEIDQIFRSQLEKIVEAPCWIVNWLPNAFKITISIILINITLVFFIKFFIERNNIREIVTEMMDRIKYSSYILLDKAFVIKKAQNIDNFSNGFLLRYNQNASMEEKVDMLYENKMLELLVSLPEKTFDSLVFKNPKLNEIIKESHNPKFNEIMKEIQNQKSINWATEEIINATKLRIRKIIIFLMTLLFISSIVLLIIGIIKVFTNKKAFIILTDKSKKEMISFNKKKKQKTILYCVGILISILCSAMGSFLYEKLLQ